MQGTSKIIAEASADLRILLIDIEAHLRQTSAANSANARLGR